MYDLYIIICRKNYFRLDVRVLLLVRDPRGTLQSRKHRSWCPGQPDCDQPRLLCSDMVDDYAAAVKFSVLYPDKFRLVHSKNKIFYMRQKFYM